MWGRSLPTKTCKPARAPPASRSSRSLGNLQLSSSGIVAARTSGRGFDGIALRIHGWSLRRFSSRKSPRAPVRLTRARRAEGDSFPSAQVKSANPGAARRPIMRASVQLDPSMRCRPHPGFVWRLQTRRNAWRSGRSPTSAWHQHVGVESLERSSSSFTRARTLHRFATGSSGLSHRGPFSCCGGSAGQSRPRERRSVRHLEEHGPSSTLHVRTPFIRRAIGRACLMRSSATGD